MKKQLNSLKYLYFIITAFHVLTLFYSCNQDNTSSEKYSTIYESGKPYTRWWWFASIIEKEDIKYQLDWLKSQHFGGVEIAFIYPVNRDPEANRIKWLSPEFTDILVYTKSYADSIGLGCDFTFGTLWPFGGTFVHDSDRSLVYNDPEFKQPLRLSWTHPDTGNVLNHMNRESFYRYAEIMGNAFLPALSGSKSALFCDSWEVETKYIWTNGFDKRFKESFGYNITPFMDSIYSKANSGPRYDYMKLLADYVLKEFYIPFTEKCHELNAVSRVQCAGSPTDLITAYAHVDIPETEAMLYEPGFSRIVASSAILASKNIISSETFTCLYGWPKHHHLEEQIADLKLVADALFANGVNQIIWHGMPFNPEGIDTIYFYATVHVGKKGKLSKDLKKFNDYLTEVSCLMRVGTPYSDVAVYLPLEDAWIQGEYPREKQMKWSWGAYELRYLKIPDEIKNYHPLWINHNFLKNGKLKNNTLYCGEASFSMLYIDVVYIDYDALRDIFHLASKGFPICLKRKPKQAGFIKNSGFENTLNDLLELRNVSSEFSALMDHPPLISGNSITNYWCRIDGEECYIFFPHPNTEIISYPLSYGQSYINHEIVRKGVSIYFNRKHHFFTLLFKPYQSVMIKIDKQGQLHDLDIEYIPDPPARIN